MEEYRSGHNEAVLKTVCPQGHKGSNPFSSARFTDEPTVYHYDRAEVLSLLGEVPKLAEGTPLERVQVVNSGARVQIPPSPLHKIDKKCLTNMSDFGNLFWLAKNEMPVKQNEH